MVESFEKQFESFFNQCSKQGYSTVQMRQICQPLIWHQRLARAKLLVKVFAALFAIYLLYSCFDCFSWFLSALGRLLLIQLLPYWNWTPLYNARCLIERTRYEDAVVSASSTARLGKYETDASNCVLCESLEHIPTVINVSFAFLEANYLERGLPVIITDSHAEKSLTELLYTIKTKASEFLKSEPCDVATNLMLKKIFNLEMALHKMNSMNKWFLQLRNCKFSAVKSSRIFMKRPYYYPVHMEPFYSSWLLLTHNYAHSQTHDIYVQGLILVQQLSGVYNMHLHAKQPCERSCPSVNIRLAAGEALLFSTDLWIFSYDIEQGATTAIATILEIDWQL